MVAKKGNFNSITGVRARQRVIDARCNNATSFSGLTEKGGGGEPKLILGKSVARQSYRCYFSIH